MADTDLIFTFVAIGILVFAFGVVVEQGYEESLDRQDVTNETVNISSFGTPLDLDGSNIDGARYDENVTARNSTDTLLFNGTDYHWRDTNGTIEFFNTVNTSIGEDVTVTYGYDEPTSTQFGFFELWAAMPAWLPAVLLVLAGFVLLSVKEKF